MREREHTLSMEKLQTIINSTRFSTWTFFWGLSWAWTPLQPSLVGSSRPIMECSSIKKIAICLSIPRIYIPYQYLTNIILYYSYLYYLPIEFYISLLLLSYTCLSWSQYALCYREELTILKSLHIYISLLPLIITCIK